MRLLVEFVLLLVAIASIADVHSQVGARYNLRLVSIKSVISNLTLYVGTVPGSFEDNSPRLYWPSTGGDENDFQWIIKDLGLGRGRVSIKSVSSGRYLDGRDSIGSQPELAPGNLNPRVDPQLQWIIGDAGNGRVSLQSVSAVGYLSGVGPFNIDGIPEIASAASLPTINPLVQWVITDLQPSARLVSIQSSSSTQFLNGQELVSVPILSPPTSDPVSNTQFQWVITKLAGTIAVSIKSVSSLRYLDGRNDREPDPRLAPADSVPFSDLSLQWLIENWADGTASISGCKSLQYLNGRNQGMSNPLLSPYSTSQPSKDRYLKWSISDVTTPADQWWP